MRAILGCSLLARDCCNPLRVDTEMVDERENVTPFVRAELMDSLRCRLTGPSSGETDTVCAVTAVVALPPLVMGIRGVLDGSARMVRMELPETLRRLADLSVEVVEVEVAEFVLRRRSDSEGRVESEGGIAS